MLAPLFIGIVSREPLPSSSTTSWHHHRLNFRLCQLHHQSCLDFMMLIDTSFAWSRLRAIVAGLPCFMFVMTIAPPFRPSPTSSVQTTNTCSLHVPCFTLCLRYLGRSIVGVCHRSWQCHPLFIFVDTVPARVLHLAKQIGCPFSSTTSLLLHKVNSTGPTRVFGIFGIVGM